MNRPHGRGRCWTTTPVADGEAGSTTLRLHRDTDGRIAVAAEVVLWDAAGQFFLETFNGDVPLKIIVALIAEAKATIKFK